METLITILKEGAILALIGIICIICLVIYIIWHLVKTAIARGVEDGIYNAVASLINKGIISDTFAEIEECKKLYNPNSEPEQSIENSKNKK